VITIKINRKYMIINNKQMIIKTMIFKSKLINLIQNKMVQEIWNKMNN
jgi:hypothetical protein